jgi:signal transduction histidine kinase
VSNAALADVCSALELVVLERRDGGFVRIGEYPLPPWFVRVFIQAQNEGVTLTSVFPVLDAFLFEADQFWDSLGTGRLSSEAFMATDSLGEELAIVATAVGAGGRRFLMMQPDAAFPERQRILQRAREQALEYERLVRQIQDLRKPVASLSALAEDLAAGPAADADRASIERIASHASTLQGIVRDLPRGPRGASPKRR